MAAAVLAGAPWPAHAQVVCSDAAACTSGGGPAVLATVSGFKDRKGRLKLELYPATEADFLKDDRELVAAGKTFRRIWGALPVSGATQICIRVPRPGRYALVAIHDRDGKNRFNFLQDGAGLPGSVRNGLSRPKVAQALVDVGSGVTTATIRMQYFRGLSGFGPTKGG